MKILLTNDDGIDAPGLATLSETVRHAVRRWQDAPHRVGSAGPRLHAKDSSCEILVVAPDRGRSECGHSLETSRQLTVRSVRDGWNSVDGTPVDCVRVAVQAMGFCPDLVFSGINAGANLGVNLMISGTFAAAREAHLMGIPALAASHYRHPDVPREWEHCPDWLEETFVEFLTEVSLRRGSPGHTSPAIPLWNVNLPAIVPEPRRRPPRVFCEVDRRPIEREGRIGSDGKVSFHFDFHARPRETGRDVDHCFSGNITVSKLDQGLGACLAEDA